MEPKTQEKPTTTDDAIETADVPSTALVPRPNVEYRLALEPRNFDEVWKMAAMAAKLQLCGVTGPEDAAMRIMAGRERGLSTFQSLRVVYVVNNRPGFDTAYLAGEVQRLSACEYFEPVYTDDKKATYRTKRKGRPEFVFTYTIEDADRDGLLKKKGSWDTSRPDMLRARCQSKLIRAYWQEVSAGIETFDELKVIEAKGEPVPDSTPDIVPQAVARDFKAEFEAVVVEIQNAHGKDELKAIRKKIDAFEGGEEMVTKLRAFYVEVHQPKKQTTPEPEQAAPPAGGNGQ